MRSTILLIAFCFTCMFPLFAQDPASSLRGVVRTSDGKPAYLVSVVIKELKKGVTTDEKGTYQFKNIPDGRYTIIVSYVGLETMESQVEFNSRDNRSLDFSLRENRNELEEIVISSGYTVNERNITAGKIAIRPMDLPQAITIIGRENLERQQVLRVSDVLQQVNGVYLSGTTGGFQEEISARGFSFSSANTFKNGVRFNNAVMPEMSGVERVEFLKGGSAVLFGNVAPGGIMNIVTKKPKFTQGGGLSFRTGSFGFIKPQLDIYGSLDKQQTAAFRVNTTYEKANSFRDKVSSTRFYINPSFLFKLGGKTELLISGDYLSDDRTPDFGTGAINYEVAKVPRNYFLGVDWGYNKSTQSMVNAALTTSLNKNWQFTGTAAWQQFRSSLLAAARPNTGGFMIQQDGTWIRGLQKSRSEQDYFLLQADFTGKFNTGSITHQLLAGADADQYYTDSYTFQTTAYNNGLVNTSIRNRNIYDTINVFDPYGNNFSRRNDIPYLAPNLLTSSPIFRTGVYVQDLLHLSSKWKFLAGLRYSRQENQRATVDTMAKGTRGYVNPYLSTALNPRAGLVFQPDEKLSFFVSYTNNFSPNTGVDTANNPLKPSVIGQWEAGFKSDLLKKKLSVNLTTYIIRNSDLSLAVVNPPAAVPAARELVGEVTSQGVELDIQGKPVNGLLITAGYSFNDTRYTKTNSSNSSIKKGDRLRYNPSHTANVHVNYAFAPQSRLKGFTAGAGVYYVGDRLAGRNNTATNPGYKLMALPDYVLVDLSAGYATGRYTARVKISNLFDQLSYNVHDDNSVNPIAPRQYAFSIQYSF